MGGCLSSSDYSTHRKPCASVVSSNGQLRQYPVPITVSQVLQSETSSPQSFFLCNSDLLYFDEYIPSLDSHQELQSAQIYFVLPTTKLKYRLAASDMAALAVKASLALEQINHRSSGNKKARISPVLLMEEDSHSNNIIQVINESKISSSSANYNKSSTAGLGVSRSGSVRKLSRYSSKRAKLAVRSFRIRLTTINEGSVLLFN